MYTINNVSLDFWVEELQSDGSVKIWVRGTTVCKMMGYQFPDALLRGIALSERVSFSELQVKYNLPKVCRYNTVFVSKKAVEDIAVRTTRYTCRWYCDQVLLMLDELANDDHLDLLISAYLIDPFSSELNVNDCFKENEHQTSVCDSSQTSI